MDTETQTLIERVHASPTQAVVAVAGAGAQAIAWLLAVPGASRTILEAVIPYSPASFAEFLGYEPQQFVSDRTAMDMARAAYRRAVNLRRLDAPVVGVACTGTLATDRPKRGEHRCHVAVWSQYGVSVRGIEFVKGLRDREGEDETASRLILRALGEACDIDVELPMALDERERVQTQEVHYQDPIRAFLAEQVTILTVASDGEMAADIPVRGGVLPGSFNPLHEGHTRLADAASAILGGDVTYELSVTNVDKPPLEELEIRRRVAQFARSRPVVLTRALVFHQKARLFPDCTFVIGWDTAVRLVDPRYYGGQEHRMLLALEEIKGLGCRFLVAGRADNGVFRGLDDVGIPRMVADMFTPIPESAFRYDLSSTALRLAGGSP